MAAASSDAAAGQAMMERMVTHSLPWQDPIRVMQQFDAASRCCVLLYSGQRTAYTGRYSWLALEPQEILSGSDPQALASRLTRHAGTLENAWFGYLGYEARAIPADDATRRHFNLPGYWFARFGVILQFDHDEHRVLCHHLPHLPPPGWNDATPAATPLPVAAIHLTASCTRSEYLASVARTIEAIRAGAFSQANITRKFMGRFTDPPSGIALFAALCTASPAAYSAYVKTGDTLILSSSPERFLTLDAGGRMESRPIKGTAPRSVNPTRDAALRDALQQSEKDRAENLMIVDLMRNDLAMSAEVGSVRVQGLFEVATYRTLHHMASTVQAAKREDVTTLAAVLAAFPPGSMTGSPKQAAIQWCHTEEHILRGVYSGALGWFGGDGSCDLSVVIRTLVIQGSAFEFQVGGGIVADSDPTREWEETMTKAKGICTALGIEISALEGL